MKRILPVLCLMLPLLASAASYHVPGDFGNLEYALMFASSGDTILLAAGEYHESALTMTRPVVLRGATGDPADVILLGDDEDTILTCDWAAGQARLEALTLSDGWGETCGGMRLDGGADVVVSHCVFRGNLAGYLPGGGRGGAVGCFDQSRLIMLDCRIEDNSAVGGGGVYGQDTSVVELTGCLIIGNDATWGSGLEVRDDCIASVDRCTFVDNISYVYFYGCITTISSVPVRVASSIIAFTSPGMAVYGEAVITDSDLYGNEHGDWTGPIADQLAEPCNMAADPLFVAEEVGDYRLLPGSPCLADGNTCGVEIGAFGVGGASDVAGAGAVRAVTVTGCRPNPFNPSTTVSFALARDGRVRVDVVDAAGRSVAVLLDAERSAGEHAVAWNGRDARGGAVPSGVYFARVAAGAEREVRKLTLLK